MQRGEIWLVNLDPTAGHEQRGTRPVVIVSPAPFNELTMTPVVLPITTGGNFARRRGFAVSLDDAGTRTTGVIVTPIAAVAPEGVHRSERPGEWRTVWRSRIYMAAKPRAFASASRGSRPKGRRSRPVSPSSTLRNRLHQTAIGPEGR